MGEVLKLAVESEDFVGVAAIAAALGKRGIRYQVVRQKNAQGALSQVKQVLVAEDRLGEAMELANGIVARRGRNREIIAEAKRRKEQNEAYSQNPEPGCEIPDLGTW